MKSWMKSWVNILAVTRGERGRVQVRTCHHTGSLVKEINYITAETQEHEIQHRVGVGTRFCWLSGQWRLRIRAWLSHTAVTLMDKEFKSHPVPQTNGRRRFHWGDTLLSLSLPPKQELWRSEQRTVAGEPNDGSGTQRDIYSTQRVNMNCMSHATRSHSCTVFGKGNWKPQRCKGECVFTMTECVFTMNIDKCRWTTGTAHKTSHTSNTHSRHTEITTGGPLYWRWSLPHSPICCNLAAYSGFPNKICLLTVKSDKILLKIWCVIIALMFCLCSTAVCSRAVLTVIICEEF